nr:hypothetical protein CFP56_19374 [Quercus suber]
MVCIHLPSLQPRQSDSRQSEKEDPGRSYFVLRTTCCMRCIGVEHNCATRWMHSCQVSSHPPTLCITLRGVEASRTVLDKYREGVLSRLQVWRIKHAGSVLMLRSTGQATSSPCGLGAHVHSDPAVTLSPGTIMQSFLYRHAL